MYNFMRLFGRPFLAIVCAILFTSTGNVAGQPLQPLSEKELQEIMIELQKDPGYLEKHPDLAARVDAALKQLLDDPALAKELNAQDNMVNEFYEDKYKAIIGLLHETSAVIQNLSQIVSNNQIRKINKRDVLTKLQDLQRTITEIERGPLAQLVNATSVNLLFAFTQTLVRSVRTTVKSGMQEFPPVDIATIIKRSGKQLALDDLDPALQQLSKDVARLKVEERQVGRNFVQRQFKWLRQFCTEHHVVSRLGYTALTGILLYIILLKMPSDLIPDSPYFNWLKELKKRIGGAPTFTPTGALIRNYKIRRDNEGHIVDEIPMEDEKGLGYNALALFGCFNLLSTVFEKSFINPTTLCKPFELHTRRAWNWVTTKAVNTANFFSGDPAVKSTYSWLKDPRYKFNDVIGYESHKQALSRIKEYVLDAEKFERAGVRPERIICYGKPQTGKSMIIEALAGEIIEEQKARGITDKLSFLVFSAEEINTMGIELILALAEAQAPCIIFLDEIDLLGLQRERNAKMLCDFLQALSGCMHSEKSHRIVLIAATNKPENLDQALLRHGRFGKALYFDFPSLEERRHFLRKKLLFDLGLMIEEELIEKLARETEECTYNDLNAFIVTALQDAKMHHELVGPKHLEAAFDEDIRHMQLGASPLPDAQQRIVATHQAAAALATRAFNPAVYITKVTTHSMTTKIKEETLYWASMESGKKKDMKEKFIDALQYGHVFTAPKEAASLYSTDKDRLAQCKVMLAGQLAQELMLGTNSSYHADDRERAYAIARAVAFKGLDPKNMPKKVHADLCQKAYAMVEQCEAEVVTWLAEHKNAIQALADSLMKQQTLTGDQVEELLAPPQPAPSELNHDEPEIIAPAA